MVNAFPFRRCLLLAVILLSCMVAGAVSSAKDQSGAAWYKGNTHCHSFWSDGDDFPEMVADWYKRHGYQFLALSDHNVLMRGAAWRDPRDKDRPIPQVTIENCRRRFGPSAVETRGEGASLRVRLATLDEVRRRVEESGKFMLIENQEVNGKCGQWEVHLNAINLAERIPFRPAADVVETFRAGIRAAGEQAARLRRPIAVHLNHPSWPYYHVTAEDLAALPDARSCVVCNASEGSNRLGDALHPSTDRIWDIASSLRIAVHKCPPLYGVASDDAHNYQQFAPNKANPGRGFLMVRAKTLSAEAITQAIDRGDFYASTGVLLRELNYDQEGGRISLAVQARPGVKYTIEFIGTLASFDRTSEPVAVPAKEGKPQRPVRRYSADIGKVLARAEGAEASYTLTGRELYVRVAVRSGRRMENPPAGESQVEEAWLQPVGWEKWVGKP